MITRREWRWAATWAVGLVIITTLPYLIAYLLTPNDLVYTGFLSNPEDGHTYLAKMRQGLRGEWLHHLPFTAEPHKGEFLITYYLFLGHVSRWTGLPPILIFHLARAVNGLLLLPVLYAGIAHFLEDQAQRRFAFLITALGSGFGWLAALFGVTTVDLWVPEGYIFYSIFVNPHFPLAIALMVLLILWSVTPWKATALSWRRLGVLALCTAALAIVQPFCLLNAGTVVLIYALFRLGRERRLPWREIASGAVIGAVSVPFALNIYLASTRNPAFAAWSAQNQTPSPPPWNYVVGYGLVLILALVGLWKAARRRTESDVLLISWVVCTALLVYAPFGLQRRLIIGAIVPLGALAAMGWFSLPRRKPLQAALALGTAGLTNLFLIGITLIGGVVMRNDVLFVTRDEWAAFAWLAENAPQQSLVIASPQTGLYIPAWSGQRVFYGHRFETVNAEARQKQLQDFYQNGDRALWKEKPDYVFYGPRERALAGDTWQPDPAWTPVFQRGDVTIYAIDAAAP